jgi:hypothetical protein
MHHAIDATLFSSIRVGLIREFDGNFLATVLGFDLDTEIDTAVP